MFSGRNVNEEPVVDRRETTSRSSGERSEPRERGDE